MFIVLHHNKNMKNNKKNKVLKNPPVQKYNIYICRFIQLAIVIHSMVGLE
jgi:hypothetical protein